MIVCIQLFYDFRPAALLPFYAMSHDVELLILGGGCAGLSLAMQLAKLGPEAPSTLILEQRPCYENDRTWCFWGDEKTPFALQALHQWSSFQVANEGVVVRVDCADTPYRMLAAEQFYGTALAALSVIPQMHLKMQSPVLSEPEFVDGRWHLLTPAGPVSATMLVDTRPQPPPTTQRALLWQSFLGQEIECLHPVFDPSCAELMNFSTPSADRVAFTYVLPVSPTRALIEVTVFAASPLTADALADDLDHAVALRVKGFPFEIRRSEQGILPMGLIHTVGETLSPPTPSFARVGLFAGAARPATGYAFQRIQRWAADCAKAIAGGCPPIGHASDRRLMGWMDDLFLNVVRRQPELAPSLFMDLFYQMSSQRVIRFLGDSGTLTDAIAMAWALPSKPFLLQLFNRPRWP